MRTEAEIRAIVVKSIADTFRFPIAAISESTTAADVDGWDSVSTSKLFFGIEDALGLELPIEKLLGSKNVGELVSVISAFADRGAASA